MPNMGGYDRSWDRSWRRLPWLVPTALAATALALTGFIGLLTEAPSRTVRPRSLEIRLVELPPQALPATVAAPSAPAPADLVPPLRMANPVPVPPPRKPIVPRAKEPSPTAVERSPSPSPAAMPPSSPTTPRAVPPRGGDAGARAIFKPMPELPPELRQRNIEWVAVARFRVAADGSAQVELAEPTSEPTLNRLLLKALERWRFFPATVNGRQVPSTVEIQIPIVVR